MIHEWKPHWKWEKIDESRCRAAVHEEGRGVGFHQCSHKVKYDGKWCGIHRPGAAEAREAKRGPTKFEQKLATQKAHAEYVERLESVIGAEVGGETPGDTLIRLASLITKIKPSTVNPHVDVFAWCSWLEDLGRRLNDAIKPKETKK